MLARIKKRDEHIHAFRRYALPGSAGPGGTSAAHRLARIAVAIKENIDVAGWPTVAGLGRSPPVAATDAPCVARLRAVGAVLVGHTAMDEAALGGTTDNPHYGRTTNPRRGGVTPGGSSGGSAAAVAAGMVPLAVGTDTLGSVRIPAAYCGVVGFKPSFGRIDASGVTPLSPSLDHVGILAESVDLAATAFAVMADPPSGAPAPIEPRSIAMGIADALASVTLEPAVQDCFAGAVALLNDAGFDVRRVTMPGWNPAAARKAGFLLIEVEGAAVYARDLDGPAGPLSEGAKKLLRFGRDCAPDRLAAAQAEIERARSAAAAALAEVDVLVLPTCPQVAFSFGVPVPQNQADLTALANLAGLPAISLPLFAPDSGELPVGLQLVGRRGRDEDLLEIAAAVARAL
jgi:aspartyl-tRNA(Asn)/glutamyl-tRNA(Gln) amidotransferase subunit A